MADLRNQGPASSNLLSASAAIAAMQAREMTSETLVASCLARIQARDAELGAWAHVNPERALEQARALDRVPAHGPLHGLPVGIKDVLDTYDMTTAHGSVIYQSAPPGNDSACVAALRRAGAVILGKTATTEFASPIAIGVRNPHDITRTAGVSSSGSAAAVADFMVPFAIGTQTGGSVIRPAAYCGIYGYKATIGSLDRGGIRHLRPSLDTLGLFARSLEDIALLRAALIGAAPGLSAWPNGKAPRLGLCRTHEWQLARPETRAAIASAVDKLIAADAEITEIILPDMFANALDAFRVIATVEGVRSLEREIREHLETMNPWLRQAAEKAASITDQQYQAALAHAAACRLHLSRVFGAVDALITPASAGEAPQQLSGIGDQSFCPLWTMLHGPCVCIPAFTGPSGMPMGLQIVGPLNSDDRTIAISAWIAEALSVLPQ